jgi:squalene-hopene/tetraprenyl-beta-curcumene cyclase
MHYRNLALLAICFFSLSCTASAQKLEVTPSEADEPKAAQLSLARAAEYMDQTAVAWIRTKNCASCHSTYLYLMARPALKGASPSPSPSPAEAEIRKFLETKAANWDTKKPQWDTEVVATATTLAVHDARTTGKLHPITRQALDRMWKLQRKDGAWNWLKLNQPPMEHDDYFGATMAAVGLGLAPEGYAVGESAKEGVAKLRKYFAEHAAPDLHHKAMLLWASQRLDGLMTEKEQQETVEQLLALQQPDGGWSLASLGSYKHRNGKLNPKDGPSDGYGTGFVIYILRQAGVGSDHDRIKKGIAWLQANQRAGGSWYTRSLTEDHWHFITHAGTAYAVMALTACDIQPAE